MKGNSIELTDNALVRRYFAKLERVVSHLRTVVKTETPGADPGNYETEILTLYLDRLEHGFAALSWKHQFAGVLHNKLPHNLEIDVTDSGLPVFREVIELENDLGRVEEVLLDLPTRRALRKDILDHALKYKVKPRDLQFALARRHYFELLRDQQVFLPRFRPDFVPVKSLDNGDRRYLAHWAVYDTQRNIPNIYIMVLDDSGKTPLHKSEELAPHAADALLSQSISTLKLVTIASGFDRDFPTLHPKSLKRVHIGPLYSSSFTRHSDSVQAVLEEHAGSPGDDWIFAWTVETLASKDTQYVSAGLFSERREEVFHVDTHGMEAFEAGASGVEKFMILPVVAYQSLVDAGNNSLKSVRKYVVGPDHQILTNP